MNKTRFAGRILFLLLLAGTFSCKKDKRHVPPSPEPVVRPKGQPIGDVAKIMVDGSGGTLTSGDGKLTVQVPSGALDVPLELSVQPVSTTLDDAALHPAYRLLPEGVSFKKPVTLTFHVPEGISTPGAENTLMIAYQRESGIWAALPTILDKHARKLQVETTHLSDWVWFDELSLRPDKTSAAAGEQVKLSLMNMELAPLVRYGHIDEAPLAAFGPVSLSRFTDVGNWKIVSGPGTITPQKNVHGLMGDAVYTAPAAVAVPQEVEIQVEVTGKGHIRDPGAPDGRRPMGKMILLTKIRLVPATYFTAEIGGEQMDLSIATASVIGGNIAIAGGAADHTAAISINCTGSSPGTYRGGADQGQSFVIFSFQPVTTPKAFFNHYLTCPGEREFSGQAVISQVGEYIEGSFSGNLFYSNQSCGYTESKMLKAAFRIKNISR